MSLTSNSDIYNSMRSSWMRFKTIDNQSIAFSFHYLYWFRHISVLMLQLKMYQFFGGWGWGLILSNRNIRKDIPHIIFLCQTLFKFSLRKTNGLLFKEVLWIQGSHFFKEKDRVSAIFGPLCKTDHIFFHGKYWL